MKKVILKVIIITLFASTAAMAANVVLYNNTIKLGANEIRLSTEIYNIDNKTYMPVRELCEKMRIPVVWHDDDQSVELQINNKSIPISEFSDKPVDYIIPDEETAYQIGKIILEKALGQPMEFETDKGRYYLDVQYHIMDNSWRIAQQCQYKIGGGGGTGVNSPTVVLNKNTGEVIYINTWSVYEIQGY